jgi:hypothetical protein
MCCVAILVPIKNTIIKSRFIGTSQINKNQIPTNRDRGRSRAALPLGLIRINDFIRLNFFTSSDKCFEIDFVRIVTVTFSCRLAKWTRTVSSISNLAILRNEKLHF